jgi:hypothetical protein
MPQFEKRPRLHSVQFEWEDEPHLREVRLVNASARVGDPVNVAVGGRRWRAGSRRSRARCSACGSVVVCSRDTLRLAVMPDAKAFEWRGHRLCRTKPLAIAAAFHCAAMSRAVTTSWASSDGSSIRAGSPRADEDGQRTGDEAAPRPGDGQRDVHGVCGRKESAGSRKAEMSWRRFAHSTSPSRITPWRRSERRCPASASMREALKPCCWL